MVRKTISCMAIAVAAILASAYTLTGCQSHQGDEDQLENDIDSFATYYFNWQFPKTQKYCTQSSEPWLRYAASNVHQADVDLLRTKAEAATIEINDIDFSDDGANATFSITVYNFLQMDTIGQEAHLVEEADFHLPMRIENGVWKIRMVNLPRSERRNRD